MDQVIYSESQRQLRRRVRDFVKTEVIPVASEFDVSGEVPERVYEAFFKAGLLHGYIPEEYGGRGHNTVDTTIVAEELAFGCPSIAAGLIIPILPISLVLRAGTQQQKETFLSGLAKSLNLPALACTEAEAGSDLRSIRTRAVRNGSQYVISGAKTYVSNLPYAKFVIVIARTEPGDRQGSPRALSAFIVPASTPGLVIGCRWRTGGLRSLAVCSCSFDNVIVGDDLLLASEGGGLSILNAALDVSRTMMASFGVGAARRVLSELLLYARKRDIFGARLLRQQDYRFKLVDMEMSIATARLLTWLAASKHDAGMRCTKEASLAKLRSGKVSQRMAGEAAAMMGGAGFLAGSVVEKFYREAPAIGLIEGPEPIQTEIVFGEMLRHGLY